MNFADELTSPVDYLIFNPPYVVTSKEELQEAQQSAGISAAWAGGENGVEVLKELIPRVKRLLKPTGTFYLLLIQENLSIINEFEKHGFKSEPIIKREVMMEKQIVFKIQFSKIESLEVGP